MATTPKSPRRVRLCGDDCGQPITVGGPRRRYLPGHAWNSARAINPESFSPAAIERFHGFIKCADNGQCWEWTGPRLNGYGSIRLGRRNTSRLFAHRVMWALTNGPLPGIVELNHRCDIGGIGKACVRPDHLFQSDHAGNAQDAASKGTLHRKLRAGNVQEMRSLHREGWAISALAERFSLATDSVRRIVRTKTTWRHITEPHWEPAPLRCRHGRVYDGHSIDSLGRRRPTCSSICRLESRKRLLAYFREYNRTRRPGKVATAARAQAKAIPDRSARVAARPGVPRRAR